jgi:YCII-related domain-containing protein
LVDSDQQCFDGEAVALEYSTESWRREPIKNKEQEMKKFVIFHYGFEMPTPEIMQEWSKWFASLGDKMVDPGSPLGPGREISRSGTTELPVDKEALTGYTIINATSLDEAEKIAKGCPMITSVRVYEAMSM